MTTLPGEGRCVNVVIHKTSPDTLEVWIDGRKQEFAAKDTPKDKPQKIKLPPIRIHGKVASPVSIAFFCEEGCAPPESVAVNYKQDLMTQSETIQTDVSLTAQVEPITTRQLAGRSVVVVQITSTRKLSVVQITSARKRCADRKRPECFGLGDRRARRLRRGREDGHGARRGRRQDDAARLGVARFLAGGVLGRQLGRGRDGGDAELVEGVGGVDGQGRLGGAQVGGAVRARRRLERARAGKQETDAEHGSRASARVVGALRGGLEG